jgi:hypothetical protein
MKGNSEAILLENNLFNMAVYSTEGKSNMFL